MNQKLAKLILMLSSDIPGEQLAAVAAIKRTLSTKGQSLHDLVALLDGKSNHSPERASLAEERAWDLQRRVLDLSDRLSEANRTILKLKTKAKAAEKASDPRPPDLASRIDFLLSFASQGDLYLSEKERGFLLSIRRFAVKSQALTSKQLKWLNGITERANRMNA